MPFRRRPDESPELVASEVVHDAVGQMVRQFADPMAFLRELVQNSIDAGSTRIDVSVDRERGDGERATPLTVSASDDGCGMDQETVERCLLVLFRSSKDRDATKIGKFGVGFFSVFAPGPTVVVVETGKGRDAPGLRLTLSPKYTYVLEETPGRRGTVVRLEFAKSAPEAERFAASVVKALSLWCPHVAIPLHVLVTGCGSSDCDLRIDRPFELSAAVKVVAREGDGTVHGIALHPVGRSEFYNRGLLLHVAPQPELPGVWWKVDSPRLHHTVSRDDVRRDDAFVALRRKAESLCREALRQRVISAVGEYSAECVRAAREGKVAEAAAAVLEGLCVACLQPMFAPRPDEVGWPLVDAVAGAEGDGLTVRIAERWLRSDPVFHAPASDALTRALARRGTAVLRTGLGREGTDSAMLHLAERLYKMRLAKAHERFTLLRVTEDDPKWLVHLRELLGAVDLGGVVVGEFDGAAQGRLFVVLSPDTMAARGAATEALLDEREDEPYALREKRVVAIDRRHAKVQTATRAAAKDARLAALVLARVVLLGAGQLDAECDGALLRQAVLG